ncbi:hypothetical protein [Luteolibacter sp. LG18]|uniref:hypothetical protein n=1 Tax=Luteolibacter sp. LG18 TaxID=2819286 RepID=UPI002B31CC74|nr:hypothetical protein llg_40990 [Luteolibacter sp. LG18]
MSHLLLLQSDVQLGVVPTQIKFAGGLAPDASGRLPREADGRIMVVAEMDRVCGQSPVRPTCTQVTYFAGTDAGDIAEMFGGLRALGLEVHMIMMVAGANPMEPSDEDAVVAQLVGGLAIAKEHHITHVSSTSVEEWMRGDRRRDGADFDAAVAQTVKVHARAVREAGLEGSSIVNWHLEFLRPGEFKTFTDIGRVWQFVQGVNKELGKTFFKILADAAHCGDSGLSIPENQVLIKKVAAAGELGIFHASAKTTRGCLSTDDGWIAALLGTAASTGELRHVFVEVFHHEDEGLAPLRALDPGHGIDTRDGRTYTQVVIDGLVDVARRLNNLKARGILK